MSDPTLPLQAVLISTLKAHPGVQAEVADRVFDAIPSGAPKPYINLGKPEVLPDKYECVDGSEISWPIHGWAAGPPSVAIKRLGGAILAALDEVELAPVGHRVVVWELEQTIYLDDPDPTVQHVVVTFRGLTEPTP